MTPAARRRWQATAAEVAVLVLLPALWWWPLLAGQLPDFMDTVTQIYPYRLEAARQLHAGVLPVWNPHQFGGHPLAANPQVGVWYPPNWLFFAWPGPWTNGVVCWLHYVLAGYGMARLVGCWTRRREAQLFAGFTFAFSAALVSRIALTPHLFTVPWMPWILWAAEKAAREGAARERDPHGARPTIGPATMAAGVFMALQFLAGSPQISYYTALVVPVWWMVRRWAWRRMAAGSTLGWMAAGLVRGLVAGGLALLLSGIQLLPTLELLAHSARTTIAIDKLVGQGLNGWFIIAALLGGTGPRIEDTDSIQAIGPGALALALLALVRWRSRGLAITLIAVCGASLLLSVGALVPVWAKVLPMYESFHAPRRALLWWTVMGSAGAGLGAALVCHWMRRRPAARVVLLVVLASGTLAMLPRLERVFTDTTRFQPRDDIAEALASGGRFVALDPGFNFSYDSRRPDYGDSMMPNLATWHALPDANGYDPLVPRGVAMLRDEAVARAGNFYPSHGVFFTDVASPLLRLMAVRHVVGRVEAFDPARVIPGAAWNRAWFEANAARVVDDGRWPVWRLDEARPWAWSARAVALAATQREAIAVADDPAVAVVELEQASSLQDPTGVFEVRPVVVSPRDARTWDIAIEPGRGPAFVCLSVAWMPGWVARDQDGQRLDIVRAHGCILGIVVPSDATAVVVRHEPASLGRGALVTLGGLLVGAWLALRARRRARALALRGAA